MSHNIPSQTSKIFSGGAPEVESIQNHPIYWFADGSLVLDVEIQRFKVHHTLLSRHSRFFSSLPSSLEDGGKFDKTIAPSGANDLQHVVLEPKKHVRVQDVEALLQHLYHDVPLSKDSSFDHVVSILRVSSPQQLDFPHLHTNAREIFAGMFPTDPATFTHNHPLHDALSVATDFNMTSVRKAILYSLVTTTDFDVSDTTPCTMDPHDASLSSPSVPEPISTNTPDSNSDSMALSVGERAATPPSSPSDKILARRVLAPADAEICMTLMTRFIEHFTPILFTPAATPHMACTDVFADTWMPLVIQPALQDDGVYKPLETLERIKIIDWAKEGLCASCVVEKREEWTEEQRTVWNLMDSWLGVVHVDNVSSES